MTSSGVLVYDGELSGDSGEVRGFAEEDSWPEWRGDGAATLVTLDAEPGDASVEVTISIEDLLSLPEGTVLTAEGEPDAPIALRARSEIGGEERDVAAHRLEVRIEPTFDLEIRRAAFVAHVMHGDEEQVVSGSFRYGEPSDADGDIDEWD